MIFDRRTRLLSATAFGFTVLGAAAGALSANPATAAGIITAVTTVSCSVTGTNWCISGNNSSSGIGVIGTSKTGTGLRGASTSQYGLNATSVSGTAILAKTTSGPYAIDGLAEGSKGTGVAGLGATNGVFGATSTGTGVTGEAYSSGTGVYGVSATATGAWGDSGSGTAVRANSDTGIGVDSSSSTNYAGRFNSVSGYGVFATSATNVAFVGRTAIGNASDIQGSYIGLLGRAPTNGFPLVATDANAKVVFQVDGSGTVAANNYYYLRSTASGGKARSFGASTTQPTIEDTGTAQLVSGVAVVRLDPTFAASIDLTTAYRVFVTPSGDTRGLYVANRTAAGFVVRESQAGRSTVAFDYRIVATALGKAGQRMALINAASDTSLAKAPLPVLPAVAIPPSPKSPALAPLTP